MRNNGIWWSMSEYTLIQNWFFFNKKNLIFLPLFVAPLLKWYIQHLCPLPFPRVWWERGWWRLTLPSKKHEFRFRFWFNNSSSSLRISKSVYSWRDLLSFFLLGILVIYLLFGPIPLLVFELFTRGRRFSILDIQTLALSLSSNTSRNDLVVRTSPSP